MSERSTADIASGEVICSKRSAEENGNRLELTLIVGLIDLRQGWRDIAPETLGEGRSGDDAHR
jgi:hypothetical protein